MRANWIQKADLWLLYSGFPQEIYIVYIYSIYIVYIYIVYIYIVYI